MANFDEAYKLIAGNESGYTANPDDNGNWTGGHKGVGRLIGTKNGVSAPVLKEFLKREPSVGEMQNLSNETVKAIFKKNYWDRVRGDEIKDQETAFKIADDAVNSGVSAAVYKTQMALGILPSFKMDNRTLQILNNQI